MANPEHLKILKQGVEVWNKWRDKNKGIKPDFHRATLNKEILSGANLCESDFRWAVLIDADLSGALLAGADLSDAMLQGANLSKANLCRASLNMAIAKGANLREAKLCEASLYKTILSEANLREADLSRSKLHRTRLERANLYKAIFTKANLNSSILIGANLEEAILIETSLNWAKLSGADLSSADLSKATLTNAELLATNLDSAVLSEADLSGADFSKANFSGATICRARFLGVNLTGANLNNADLSEAHLNRANLIRTSLVETILNGTDLSESSVYGISVWNLKTNKNTKQLNLLITDEGEPAVTVDNIEVAQFLYLLLNNENIRNIIDTIGGKGVLIIGRFSEKRKEILHAIRDELRSRYNLLPIMFEFNPLAKDPTIKTLTTLAHLSRFVIADLTNAKSVLQELATILKDLPTLPVKPIIHESDGLPPMGDSFLIMQSMLKPYVYTTKDNLLSVLKNEVIEPAEERISKFEAQLAEIRREWFPWQQE
jgi:uncharacterized protein YjbI with pentapeptide repeats